MIITIEKDGEQRCVRSEAKLLLSGAIRMAGFSHDMPCGGKGTCAKCRVNAWGSISEITAREHALLGGAQTKGERLSCLAYALGDCTVVLPGADMDAVALGELPLPSDAAMGMGLGAAVDVGTTTVAVYLYDFANKQLIGQDTFKNPQQAYGADVISRIQAQIDGHGAQMQSQLVQQIEQTLLSLCANAHSTPSQVDSVVITGNTAMLHLITGADARPLSCAPFEITEHFGRYVDASSLGFSSIKSSVYLPHVISAFLGGDVTCAMLSCKITDAQSPVVLIDIGTNGEMVLVQNGVCLACSTAAGPAFEGAGITQGMPARAGAIDKVWVSGERIEYTTLHKQKAVGLCGSGVIDAVAAFLSAGLIDPTGAICTENEDYADYLDEIGGMPALRVGDSGIFLTQADVRAIQLAKSAICAGLKSLLHAGGVALSQVHRLIIAGGFGAFINVQSAAVIGLIPQALADQSVAVGNAAGMGALALLLDATLVKDCAAFASNTQQVELSTNAYFIDGYIQNMMFEV